MRVYTSDQISHLDKKALEVLDIPSTELMDRAAKSWSFWFMNKVRAGKSVHILVGPGNNGGDGWVIARVLAEHHFNVIVVSPDFESVSPDHQLQKDRFIQLHKGNVLSIEQWMTLFPISPLEIIVDAMFGISLNRPLDGNFEKYVNAVNQQSCDVFSVDMPSGLHCERGPIGTGIKAKYTGSMACAKPAFFLPESHEYVGVWECIDIGWPEEIHLSDQEGATLLTSDLVKKIWQPRKKHSYKGSHGHGALIAGSRGMMGASILASKAALRSGIGLLTSFVPEGMAKMVHGVIPEALVQETDDSDIDLGMPGSRYRALAYGPGVGRSEKNQKTLGCILNSDPTIPLILDADGLYFLNYEPFKGDYGLVITPHVGEFDRIFGSHSSTSERYITQSKAAVELGWIIVLKGVYTRICFPTGHVYYNTSGNAGLAKAGSGDVLTGMMLGMTCRLNSLDHGVLSAVYLHGLAADCCADHLSMESMIASDVIDHISDAFKSLSIK